MGAALIPILHDGERCATVEIKINYFKPVLEGELTCTDERKARVLVPACDFIRDGWLHRRRGQAALNGMTRAPSRKWST
jgi:hypothetical protein